MTVGIIYHEPDKSHRSGTIVEADTVHLNTHIEDLPDMDDPDVLDHDGGTIHHLGMVYDFDDEDSVYITDDRVVVSPHNPSEVLN